MQIRLQLKKYEKKLKIKVMLDLENLDFSTKMEVSPLCMITN
jgi:hypothetical protein